MIIENAIVILGVFIIAFIFAPIGLGGGMLFAPLIHYTLDWPIDSKLIAVSLLLTGVVSWGSGLTHRKEKLVDNQIIRTSLLGAIPGAIFGVIIIQSIESDFEIIFKVLSIVLISFALSKMTFRNNESDEKLDDTVEKNTSGIILGSGIGGLLSSVLAIGAGAIYVPTLKIFGRLKTRYSIGSSLNIMMIVVPIAALSHLLILTEVQTSELFEQIFLILTMLSVTFIGSRFGAKLGIKHLDEKKVIYIFISVLVVIWLRYIIDVLF